MFNEGIQEFINRHHGSREAAAMALGYTKNMLFKMLNGVKPVPILCAFLIELLSGGSIPADRLIRQDNPFLAKLIKRVRLPHYRVNRDVVVYYASIKVPIETIKHDKFPFCARDYFTEENKACARLLVDENFQLIYGFNALFQAQSQHQTQVTVFRIDLEHLLETQVTPHEFSQLNVLQRTAIGLALEWMLGNRQGKRNDVAQTQKVRKLTQLRLPGDEVVGRRDVLISKLCALGSKDNYHRNKNVLTKGIRDLHLALGRKCIPTRHAAAIARHPPHEQSILLQTFFNNNPKKRRKADELSTSHHA